MRPLAITLAATLSVAASVRAQQPVAPVAPPVVPVTPAVPAVVPVAPPVGPGAGAPIGAGGPGGAPGVPVAGAPADPALDAHLAGWEKTMTNVVNFRAEINLTRTDGVFKKEKKYGGVLLCMKPNYAILRLDNLGDPTRTDYEAVICNGKSAFQYSGMEKTITEFKLPQPAPNVAGSTDNLMLDFLSGLKATEAKRRFEISVFREDGLYVYLSIKPRFPRDQQEFEVLKLALYYGPKVPQPQMVYLPRQVLMIKPNGDKEVWDLPKAPVINLPGIDANAFQFRPVPGFTLKPAPIQQQQPMPPGLRPVQPMLPGGNGLPAGPGVVRP